MREFNLSEGDIKKFSFAQYYTQYSGQGSSARPERLLLEMGRTPFEESIQEKIATPLLVLCVIAMAGYILAMGDGLGMAIFFGLLAGFFLWMVSLLVLTLIPAILSFTLHLTCRVISPVYRISYLPFIEAVRKYQYDLLAFSAWVERKKEEFWRSLSGVEFENELAKLFMGMGYQVELTPKTADGGVDLILKKNGKKTVVQCKAHKRPISIGTARELSAAVRDFGANAGLIACLEGVTRPTANYIADKPIEVLSLPGIMAMHEEL